MNEHLRAQMRRIIEGRMGDGYDTNARCLRLWLEWGLNPCADEERTVYNSKWFRNVPQDDDDSGWSFWLSPTGMVWTVSYADHWFFGDCMGVPEADLERAGWLHVSGGTGYQYFQLTGRQQRVWDHLVTLCHEQTGRELHLKDMCEESARARIVRTPDEAKPDRLRAFERAPLHSYEWDDDKHWQPKPGMMQREVRPIMAGPMNLNYGV